MDVERQIRNALEARFEKFGSADLKTSSCRWTCSGLSCHGNRPAKRTPPHPKKSRLPVLAAVAVGVLVVLLFGWWFMQRSGRDHVNASTSSPSVMAPASTNVPDQKSVAVLPFVNLSDDKGSEYFSDGVSEELLTVLQKFRVCTWQRAPRRFHSKARTPQSGNWSKARRGASGRGSVRKSGDAVRIAARLTALIPARNSGRKIYP